MPATIKILQHKGKEIVLFDCSNQKPEDIVSVLPEVTRTMIAKRINLLLNDITNTTSDDRIKQAAVKCNQDVSTALDIKVHGAFVGMRGIQKIIASAVARDNCFASSQEEALDWLVKQ